MADKTSSSSNQVSVYSKADPRKKPRRTRLLIIGVIIILGLVALLWYIFRPNQYNNGPAAAPRSQAGLVASHVCDRTVIGRANPGLASNDLNKLEPVVDDIKKQQNYRGDIDCDYIVTQYAIMTGDASQAQASLNDIKWAKNHGQDYASSFKPAAVSAMAIQSSIDALTAQQKESQRQAERRIPTEGASRE